MKVLSKLGTVRREYFIKKKEKKKRFHLWTSNYNFMHIFKENVHVNPSSIMTELQGEGLPRLPVPGPVRQPPPAAPFLRQTLAHPQVRSACCSWEPHLDPSQKRHWTQQNECIIFPPSPPLTLLLFSVTAGNFSLLTSHLLEVLPLLFFLALLPHLLSITLLRSLWFLT